MPRRLSIQRKTVPAHDRDKYLERLTVLKAHYATANCRFWVFEESALRGAFVEFAESEDEAALAEAIASAPNKVLDAGRIYHEVEIS